MSDNLTMFNILMNKLDDCKKQCQMLNKTLDDFDIKCSEEDLFGDVIDEKRGALINNIKTEKEYEKFYKEAIINLTKRI